MRKRASPRWSWASISRSLGLASIYIRVIMAARGFCRRSGRRIWRVIWLVWAPRAPYRSWIQKLWWSLKTMFWTRWRRRMLLEQTHRLWFHLNNPVTSQSRLLTFSCPTARPLHLAARTGGALALSAWCQASSRALRTSSLRGCSSIDVDYSFYQSIRLMSSSITAFSIRTKRLFMSTAMKSFHPWPMTLIQMKRLSYRVC